MASMNRVFLAGNLTRDPEVRYTPAGKAVGDLRLAVSRQFTGTDGQTREETCFVNVVVWGRQAETCGQYLAKGSPALVEGRLQYDEWEKDGQKFNRLRVVADRVQFIGAPRKAEFRDGDTSAAPRRAAKSEPAAEVGGADIPPVESIGDDDNLPF